MTVLDFLTEGEPQTQTTQTSLPPWLNEYSRGVLERAQQVGTQPYQSYEGPRVAEFTPDQQQAFDQTRGSVGAWQPGMQSARQMTQRAGGVNPMESAAPHMSAASQGFPDAADEYMDPYVQNVLDRQKKMSMRNLEEDFIPGLQDAFVGSGQFGSTRMEEMGLRGTRDIAENLQQQQQGALSQAYGQAGQLFQQDAARRAGLARTAGDLALGKGDLDLAAAGRMGALTQAGQDMRMRDAAALESIGSQQQQQDQRSLDVAYEDFARQRDYPAQQLSWMASLPGQMPHEQQTTQQGGGGSASPLSQLGGAAATAYGIYSGIGGKRGGSVRDMYRRGGPLRIRVN